MTTELRWLPTPPKNFRQLCAEVVAASDPSSASSLAHLAGYALDGTKLQLLAKAAAQLKRDRGSAHPLTPFRLGLLSNSTTDFFAPAIAASALRYGLDVSVVAGAYGQGIQDALDPQSPINLARCDAVVLALDYRGLALTPNPGADHADQVTAAIDFLRALHESLRSKGGAAVIFQTLAAPPESLFGSLDAVIDGTQHAIVSDFNTALRKFVRNASGDMLLDVEAIAARVGLDRWHDPVQWHLAKLPFSQHMMPLYADNLGRLLAALRGKSKKCLVLDLDNTLWGGVIGDDGVAGIELGNGSPLGEAFLEVQRTALRLRERGIILAVSSKNDDATARRPFREHPDMLLREEHIAVFQANWADKPTNLEAIARQLSLGVDSLVLLDDNPAERALVRSILPGVGVPELPDDPALYGRTLLQGGYFEAVAFSREDGQRANLYQALALRAEMQATSRDIGSYLRSLEMTAVLDRFTDVTRPRVAQLINKSNQFNLTTRRYTEAEIAALESDPSAFTLQVRLLDLFGDNGIISIVICRAHGSDWHIDTWLMSCRVLGREVEAMILNVLTDEARQRGITRLLGRFIPSGRNDMVREHYPKLGFTLIDEAEDGTTNWRLSVTEHANKEVPITIRPRTVLAE